MAESEEELKSILKKEEGKKVGLSLNIQKTKITASGPMNLGVTKSQIWLGTWTEL